MEKMVGSRDILKKSTTSPHGSDTMFLSDASAQHSEFIGGAAGTLNSHAESSTTCSIPDSDVRVEWAPWRLTHSQFRYRGTPNVIDLGEI